MSFAKTIAILLATILIGGLGFIYSGWFDPAADAPHSAPVYLALENLRHRGIATRASAITVPDLDDAALIRAGAGNYDAMCADCHLKPGVVESEMHRGLYPQPPALATRAQPTLPTHRFWIIKHGIKASGMPAWGKSMDDQAIWGMVAFLERLPSLTPAAYQEIVEQSAGHSHGTGDRSMMHGDDPDKATDDIDLPAPVSAPEAHHDDGHQHEHDQEK